jgi:hypothetical protein
LDFVVASMILPIKKGKASDESVKTTMKANAAPNCIL